MTDKRQKRLVTRREVLLASGSLAFLHLRLGVAALSGNRTMRNNAIALVGTYTGSPGSGSNGEGIYAFGMDTHTGELRERKLVAKSDNPSWIAVHPSKKYIYAANEISKFHGKNGSISSFAIDAPVGTLRLLNVVSSEGAGPAYISIDESGKYAFVANYGGGSTAILPILEDGSLGTATYLKRDLEGIGSTTAKNAPSGSFAVSGHDSPHIHMVSAAPGNKFVLWTDLAQDRIYSLRFDSNSGTMMAPSASPFVSLPAGDGPRHFSFHPSGQWLYSIQEEASTVAVFRYDPLTGALSLLQTVSALPSRFCGTSFASEILISPNGRSLYAANRLHDSIAVFSIRKDGRLRYVAETSTHGDYPGQCRIDPSGNFLYACNRRSDSITTFRIHPDHGTLSFTGQYTAVGSPACITFL